MNIKNELPKRKPTRLKDFDYNTTTAYFITLCTQNRRQILSRIVGLDVPENLINTELLSHGRIANKYIKQMNQFYENITVNQYVIMPNHIHMLLFVSNNGSPRTSTPTRQTSSVSHFISTFKRFCNKEIGEKVWQRSFHDHIIRDRHDYEKHVQYILENPSNWLLDDLYSE